MRVRETENDESINSSGGAFFTPVVQKRQYKYFSFVSFKISVR
jgi:hypothetical protein